MVSKALSDADIKKKLGKNTRIVTYPELKNYKSIDQLLEIDNRCIILIETKINAGHWCCLLKYGDVVEFFDSYGLPKIDDELSYVSLPTRKVLGEQKHLLSALLDECDEKVIHNIRDLQSWKAGVNTCGRWCVDRLLNQNKTLPEYLKYIDSFKAKNNDKLVCELVKV